MNNCKNILSLIVSLVIGCSSPKLIMQNPDNQITLPKVICRFIAIDDSKFPKIESKIDNFRIIIDSSLIQSKVSGQIYGKDSTDFHTGRDPIVYAKLELISFNKRDTVSALTDFGGNYSILTNIGEYEIIASFPIKNSNFSFYNKLHISTVKINKYETITLNITLGQGQGITFINGDSLINATSIKY